MPDEALREELLLLQFAAQPSIRFVRLEWEELSSLVASIRLLESKRFEPLSQRNEELVAETRKLIFKLADGPIELCDPTLGLDSIVSLARQAIPLAASARDEIENLERALVALSLTQHPAREFLEDFISARPEIEASSLYERSGEPAIVLCPRNLESVPAIEKWVTDENLFVSVSRYRQLKEAPPVPCHVLFGPPSRYEWGRSPENSHRAQWLVTTPRAEEVIFLIWPPYKEPSLEELAPWPGFTHVNSSSTTERKKSSEPEIEEFTVKETLPPKFEPHGIIVDAKRLELQGPDGSLWVYFEVSEAPHPKVFEPTDAQQSERKFPSSGAYLIFRQSQTEEANLKRLAEEWWDSRLTEPTYARAVKDFEEIRATMTTFVKKFGVAAFAEELVSRGIRKNYSTYVARRLLVPQYLAPEDFHHFEALGQVCGEVWTEADFTTIRMIRASRAQAGRMHFKNLLEMLRRYKARNLLDELAKFGYATPTILNGEPLLIARVISTSPGLHKIPPSKLGVPLMQDGLPWLA